MNRSIALAFALAFAVPAIAADQAPEPKAPDTVGPFLTFCVDHLRSCRTEIQTIDVVNSMNQAQNKQTCLLPRGVSDDDATQQVLAWLAQHNELASSSTSDGITSAIKSVWNCVAEIPNGKTGNGAPENTGEFLTYCTDAKHHNRCANVILGVSMRAYAASIGFDNGANGHCSIPKTVDTGAGAAQVYAWLGQHSETHSLDIEDTAVTAIDALWPCH
jgi:hypothetical protein